MKKSTHQPGDNETIPEIDSNVQEKLDTKVIGKRKRCKAGNNIQEEPKIKMKKQNQNHRKRKNCDIVENLFEDPNLEKKIKVAKKNISCTLIYFP